ncbi:hypothetical protein Bhyg_01663 [Pseudolycoriella hygida]|uniref:Uncharacterized protein n=1 Tax=Pseudolycoriella hygida TaxID=35572 RepID=A0A9Q0NAN0_9DIPT|nr:hypothetical protein Bhyg_01663 [Pseudolycoriella hygida]
MRHLKGNSQKSNPVRRTIGTRNSKEVAVQNDRNNIGQRIGSRIMPRTRRSAAQQNVPTTGATSKTSPSRNGIPQIQNGTGTARSGGEMESLLKKRNEVIPCMTGLDRVVNWKSSTEYAVVGYYKNDLVFSPLKQSIQRSSIQERISYDKVSSTSFSHHTSSVSDFKVPSTIQRNDNVELIDLTDDASESNTSSITTTQEELYSYLGVVTKSQTNKVEAEPENKTVKRSSLRVKVKQIALRNQEIYNQLENNRKLEAAKNNTQSLVRYNGHTAEKSSVQVRQDPRLSSKQQQITQSTYKSTTLVNNTTKPQPSSSNLHMVERNRATQQMSKSSYHLVPYSFKSSTRIQNTTNKCTVLERFVYKQKQEVDPVPIQVNADKYKTSILTSSTSNTTTVNRMTNGMAQSSIRPNKYYTNINTNELSATRKPDMDIRPQITPGIKRKAMEQWIELNSSRRTNMNHLPPNTSTSSFTSFHHQNMTTTTNISTHKKIEKVETVHTQFVRNVAPSNAFTPHSRANGSPQRKIPIDTSPSHAQSRAMKIVTVNVSPPKKQTQQNHTARNLPSSSSNATRCATIQSPPSNNVRPSTALSLQSSPQKNIGNNRISRRRLSPKYSNEMKKVIANETHSLRNVTVNVSPRKIQNVAKTVFPPGKVYSPQNSNRADTSAVHMSSPTKAGSHVNSSPKLPNSGASVSSSLSPVMKNVAVGNVSSLQTSSQQYISANGKNVTIEVTLQRNFNSKHASTIQTIQNTATNKLLSPIKNSQQNIDNENVASGGNDENVDFKKLPLVQVLRPVHHIVTSSTSSHENDSHKVENATSSVPILKDEPSDDSYNSTNMQQLIPCHSVKNALPTSSMVTENASAFDVQSESDATPSKDLNENVSKDNKPEILIDLSEPITNVQTSKRDSKTNSLEDVKPCLAITPIVCEDSSNEMKPFEVEENVNANFLQKQHGNFLAVLSFVEHFVVIQEMQISVWTLPSELFNIFGVAQRYVCIGKIERYNCDIEIDTPYQHRLVDVGNKTYYVELRAKKLAGTYTRESLMSIYLTLYSLSGQQEMTLRHIELDRVHGSITSVHYTVIPKSTSFVMCWSEVVTNVRKYNLNANMLNLESVLGFPGCRESLKKLQFFENDTIIAFGYSTITMWDSQSGDITCKIDTNTPIGDNLHFFFLNENTERALFLVQSCPDPLGNSQLIKLLAINVNRNYSWKIICTHKMPSTGSRINSMATISSHLVATYENGQSFLLNLYNPRQFVVHASEVKGTKYFVAKDKVIAVDYNQLIAKTFVDHFFG